jgi:monooxygenase
MPSLEIAPDDHVDVLIVGAGLSGIGAGAHLRMEHPGRSFAILESRAALGGTWDLFRYPGIRSDSDMFTLGYRFKVWEAAKAIADGPAILDYVQETASEYRLDETIRYNRRAMRAEWSSEDASWTVTVEHTDSGENSTLTCNFLYVCSGYYRYDEPYTPELPGIENFQGTSFHPQLWPDDLDYEGKRVVVIGSGATAMTLVPAMARDAAHVSMLQRSPTYVISMPGTDPIARALRRVLPSKAAYAVLRWKNVLSQLGFYRLSKARPKLIRKLLRRGATKLSPPGYEVDTHFNPSYDPWDQRVCLVPDGDLFRALHSGKAEIATDTIDHFDATGIELGSGKHLDADIVITATGLNLLAAGGIEFAVDGEEIELSKTVGYKGMMLSGVPNMVMTLGYTNASWTLKADLVSEYACRLLAHMDQEGFDSATPQPPPPGEPTDPFIDLKSGYVTRAIDQLPKQGRRWPWRLHQNYLRDVFLIRRGPVTDEAIEFARSSAPDSASAKAPAASAS